MPPPPKRQKLSDDESDVSTTEYNLSEDTDNVGDTNDMDEISSLKPQKSARTKKRKLRASAPSAFGATMQSLLDTQTPSNNPLSLKPSLVRKQNDEKLESRARKVLQTEKKNREDQRRITDVIGGWGVESERSLRKVAQRGGTVYNP
jgi:hypothetical protein